MDILADLRMKLQSCSILSCYQIFAMRNICNFLTSILDCGTFQLDIYVFHMFNSYLLYIRQKKFQTAQTTKLSFNKYTQIFISYVK